MKTTQLAALLLSLLLPILNPCPSCANITETFRQPPDDARPWTYWFWINGNITREGITADLEAMARVGIGGVLIMEVANPRNMAPAGPVKFGSPEWKEMFQHVVSEADRLGLKVNMNNDAGWTGSGGPWIKPENSMKQLVATTATVTGPAREFITLPAATAVEDFYRDIAVYAVPQSTTSQAANAEASHTTQPIQLTSLMTKDGQLTWNVPDGQWIITRIGYTSTGQRNKPAPEGGLGLEVDKFDPDALATHFNAFIGTLAEANQEQVGETFVSTHVDSWEVGWQNWTEGMPEEFRKRRGYDLMPWLPLLVGINTGTTETAKRFRRDFALTCAELSDEYYAAALQKLAHDKGLTLTIEGYGPRGYMNPFTYSVHADIPVSEFWLERWDAWHLLSSRLMASVAHVYGKPIIAAESFTAGANADPFTEHPYSVKATGDWAMSEGVNRFIFHRTVHDPWTHLVPGMSFAGFGWHLDRNQTWFEQSKPYMSYLRRCQWILQQGTFVADVCRLVTDGETRPHVPGMRQIPQQYEPLPDGYNYDYISDKALLNEFSVQNGQLVTRAGMKYKVLQLPQYTTMTVELAQKIAELVDQGATIVGPKPLNTPGLTNYPQSEEALRTAADKAWDSASARHVISNRNISEVLSDLNLNPDFQFQVDPPPSPASLQSVMRRAPRRPRAPQPPVMPTRGLNWIHRSLPEGDFYFVANPQHRPVSALCSFRVDGKAPEIWYPESGEIRTPAIFTSGDVVQLPIQLEPAESVFVVFRNQADPSKQIVDVKHDGKTLFGPDTKRPPAELPTVSFAGESLQVESARGGRFEFTLANGQTLTTEVSQPVETVKVQGPWTVQFQPDRGAPAEIIFPSLLDWTKHENPGIKYFSGTATYQTSFTLDADLTTATRWSLDLGNVHTIAQVRLNGQDLGVLWKAPFQVDVSDALQPGENALEIQVTNLWPNRMIGDEQYPDDSTPDASWVRGRLNAWPDWIMNKTPRPDSRRITFTTFKHYQKDSPLLPSGLMGPVTISPVQIHKQ